MGYRTGALGNDRLKAAAIDAFYFGERRLRVPPTSGHGRAGGPRSQGKPLLS